MWHKYIPITINRTEGFNSKLTSKLLITLLNKPLMFHLSRNIQHFIFLFLEKSWTCVLFDLNSYLKPRYLQVETRWEVLPSFSEVLRITCLQLVSLQIVFSEMSMYLQVLLMAILLWNYGILLENLSTHNFDCFIWFFFVGYKGNIKNRPIYQNEVLQK